MLNTFIGKHNRSMCGVHMSFTDAHYLPSLHQDTDVAFSHTAQSKQPPLVDDLP